MREFFCTYCDESLGFFEHLHIDKRSCGKMECELYLEFDKRDPDGPQALHRKAMELAEDASFEKAAGRIGRARELYADAFRHEQQAAELIDAQLELEPTRSVLFRSAAYLAIDCNDSRAAEKLLARALSGNPPPEIANELRDLLEQVNLHRTTEEKKL